MSGSPASTVARWAARRIAEGRMAGAAWWIEVGGQAPIRGHVGLATQQPQPEPLELDTPFDLASLTKPLATAPLALLLADAGRLDLSAPIVGLLPELRGTPWSDVSADELARHTAGLPAWRPLCVSAADLCGYIEAIGRIPPAVARGTALYSDLGYILLGALVERAGGESLDVMFDRRLAGPCGVASAVRFAREPWRRAAATELGNGYERAMAGSAGADHPWRESLIRGSVHDANAHGLGGVAGHAGLFGTLDGTVRLVRELQAGDRLRLSPALRRRWLRADAGTLRSVGLQAAAGNGAARGVLHDLAPGHTGFTGTSVWLEPLGPARGGFCLLLSNRVHPGVPRRSFQPVRRAFHRLVARVARHQAGRYHDPESDRG